MPTRTAAASTLHSHALRCVDALCRAQPDPARPFSGGFRTSSACQRRSTLGDRREARDSGVNEVPLSISGRGIRLRGLRRVGLAAGHGACGAPLPLEGILRCTRPCGARVPREGPRPCRNRRRREGAPISRNIVVVGLEGLPKTVADAANAAASSSIGAGERFDEKRFKDSEPAVKKALTDRRTRTRSRFTSRDRRRAAHRRLRLRGRSGPARGLWPDHVRGARSGRRRASQARDPGRAALSRDRHSTGNAVLDRADRRRDAGAARS